MEINKKEILKAKTENNSSGAQFNVLSNAEMGKVVTRFPPEPSGYLHIGHVKAAMLNYHYSKMYKGKMILRFDDTNPAKEKDEYVENIKKDLATLEIYPDEITHTSDHFDTLMKIMTECIKEGKCYCDNTNVEQMRKERTEGIPSKCRDQTPEENLAIWTEMCQSNPSSEIKTYCVRGKIDYQNNNKCLRDPVFYRFSDQVHHRVGDKYKIFPTYDFACPIVDSIEGVTHCLRTNEYNDRIAMYKWVLQATNQRDINIYEFSRLALIHTVLSKRTLKWFVDNKIVDGWYDPRFPTVQGILRRGIRVQTLKDFMISQGPSKSTVLMEWDKIYALNKDIVDPTAKRLFAVSTERAVQLHVEGLSDEHVEEFMIDWHPKNKELGQRKQIRGNRILIEYDDAKDLVEGQKLTLKGWGNTLVTKIEKQDDKVTQVFVKLNLEDTVYKNSKVIHWVPNGEKQCTKVLLIEFGHLINARKVEENQNIEEIVNKESRFETKAIAEYAIHHVKQGEVIQLERRGYFYVDKLANEVDEFIHLHFVPDGKSKNVSVIETKINVKSLSKGNESEQKPEINKEDESKKKDKKKAKKADQKANKESYMSKKDNGQPEENKIPDESLIQNQTEK